MEMIYDAGIYFGMPDDEYFAIPALSSTFMKEMLISPPDAWANSWLNPDKEEREERAWMYEGHAYHKRILEGKEAFEAAFCSDFAPPESSLKTMDDIKEALSNAGVDFKKSGGKPYLMELAEKYLPNAILYDRERSNYLRENAGKKLLSTKTFERVEKCGVISELHPHIKPCVTGGYSEVTIIWFDKGLWFKARIDKLKANALVDLKTFANKRNLTMERAIYAACAEQKYCIQAAHYREGVRQGAILAASGRVFGSVAPEWLEQFVKVPEKDFYHVWLKKDGAPIMRGMKMSDNWLLDIGEAYIQEAIHIFNFNSSKFGGEMWIDDEPIQDYDKDQFPPWAFD